MDYLKRFSLLFLSLTTLVVVSCSNESSDSSKPANGEKDESYTEAMAEEHKDDKPVPNAAFDEPDQPVTAKDVTYGQVDGQLITGYFARPEAQEENLPSIIVIHEWWGLNENIRMMTRKLAGLGYAALAVDLYNNKVAENADDARTYMQQAMGHKKKALNNLNDAYTYLQRTQGEVKTGVIGWCFGGAWSLNAALAMPQKLDACNIYYGRLVTDATELKKIEMPILGIFGAEDRGIPPKKVRRFESVLDSLGKEADIHIYDGAGHAFANPSGTKYNEQAAADAWQKTVAFFEKNLK